MPIGEAIYTLRSIRRMRPDPIVLHEDDIAPESWDDPVRGGPLISVLRSAPAQVMEELMIATGGNRHSRCARDRRGRGRRRECRQLLVQRR